jgi:hypothetical protein
MQLYGSTFDAKSTQCQFLTNLSISIYASKKITGLTVLQPGLALDGIYL